MSFLPTQRVPGPCSITFDSLALGTTKEGVIIRPVTQYEPIVSDYTGVSIQALIYSGKACVVECNISHFSEGATDLGIALLTSALWCGGLFGSGAANAIGTLASTIAASLTITEGHADAAAWVAAHAVLTSPSQLLLNSTSELVMPLAWIILPDLDTGDLFGTVPAYIV